MADEIKLPQQQQQSTPLQTAPVEVPESIKSMNFSVDEGLLSGQPELTVTKTEAPPKVEDKKVETVIPKTEDGRLPHDQSEKKGVTEGEVKKAEVKKEGDSKELPPKESEPKLSPALKPPKGEAVKGEEGKAGSEAGVKKEVIKPIAPPDKNTTDTFDYSKYSPQEQVNLKNMSRQSREYVAKLIDENKGLAKLKDSTYLQHEHGYVLSPEFQQLNSRVRMARTEGSVWEKALLDIRAGKKYREITGFDANGQPVLSGELDPSDRDEIRIQNNILACQQAEQQTAAQLQQYPNQFKERVTADMMAIQREQEARFAWVADPKILDYSVDIQGLGERKVKEIIQDFRSMIPPYMASTPGFEVAANLFAALQIQGAELNALRSQKAVESIKTNEEAKVEPTSVAKPAEVSKNSFNAKGIPSTFSLEGFSIR